MAGNHELKVTGIKKETKNTVTFYLNPIDTKSFSYKAGQFLTLLINRNGKTIRRSYSFSSTPGVDPYISITIREVQNGEVSRFLLQTINEESILHSLSPAGMFTFEPVSCSRDVFLFSAGSGVIPIFSILKQILKDEPQSNCLLLTQNRSETDIIFKEQLEVIARNNPENFAWISLLSESQQYISKRLNSDILGEVIRSYKHYNAEDALVFICGPLPFMRMIEFSLKTDGFQPEQIRKEVFMFDKIPEPSFYIDEKPKNILLTLDGKTYGLSISYPKTILQACLDAGIQLPYSCKGGRCSSCVAICNSGEVKMSINEVLTDKDLENRLILTCVGYAASDISIEIKTA